MGHCGRSCVCPPSQSRGLRAVRVREKDIDIRLSASGKFNRCHVLFDFKSGAFKPLPTEDLVFDLLSLPSRVVHREDLEREERRKDPASMQGEKKCEVETQEKDENARELEELYGAYVTPEELAKLDAQPNPFNYSDRVSQTFRVVMKVGLAGRESCLIQ
ncbi:hypothetical protein C7M84_012218 [Penaeus vannamei]|uniref:Uncharacterized protein n=1 Tax=Penaeus vannamei TaxID=6689 RepID=A0A423SZH2_PENVA|nr:hypothetical protein C7M84_012218 [Penaeus vannamei]